ncbi:MAG: hypothetical protein VKM34_06565, partial [Cyanobacteriota bacterium]|nr:hypothetical protein [Cyanobacteriota bacterium]
PSSERFMKHQAQAIALLPHQSLPTSRQSQRGFHQSSIADCTEGNRHAASLASQDVALDQTRELSLNSPI